jgi:H+/Cl- antiporter ClcA
MPNDDSPNDAMPGDGPPNGNRANDTGPQARPPRVWQIVLVALVAIVFTAVWLGIYGWLNSAVWSNTVVATHRWMIPVGVVFFSLLVGLAQKYLRAPNVIHGGGLAESLKGGGEKTDYTTFPGALVSATCSLLSGASIGPEGSLSFLIQDISAWLREKLKIADETAHGFSVAALASAYNGIFGNAVFTAVFATEYQVGGNAALVFLAWNLLAGVIGYAFYALLNLPVFAHHIPFAPISQLTLGEIAWALLLGVVGALLGILVGWLLQVVGALMDRLFGERVLLRILAAGVVIGVVVSFVPELMFDGEKQIFPMLHSPASYGVLVLLSLGLFKLVLLALAFKSGYLGGPIFPTLFACTMVGLAFSLLFPWVPASIFVLCIEVGAFTLMLAAPLTAILLVAVVGTSDPYTIALLVVSAVVALLVGSAYQRLMAQRAAQQAAVQPEPRPAITPTPTDRTDATQGGP